MLLTIWTTIESYLLKKNEKVGLIIKRIAQLNAFVAILLLVYRYGFLLSDKEAQAVFNFFNGQFLVYLALFLSRLLLSYNRKDFFLTEKFETALSIFILLHGIANYFFDFKFLLYYLEMLPLSHPTITYQHLLSIFLLIIIILEGSKAANSVSELQVKPATTFVMSFVLLILIGTGLLMLPAMTVQGSIPFVDALFTAASASCVTGLIVVDTAKYFTFKGHLVLMGLIQLGGLGIVLFATFFSSFLSSGVSLKQQSVMQNFLSSENLASAKGLLRQVVFITVLVETIGFLLIFFSWDEELWDADQQFSSLGERIFVSLFHSISAFCNGGFSTFKGGMFDEEWKTGRMYSLHLILCMLVIFGGLGFTVIEDVFHPKNIKKRLKTPWRRYQHNTRISLRFTFALLAIGTVVFMVFEFHQLTDRTIIEALITAFFQSTVLRTAGFNSMDFGSLQTPTIIVCMFMMFVGAGSGSTAGGIKVTTFVVIFYSSIANIRGQKNINILKRNIPTELVNRAYAILMFAVTYNTAAIFLLSITESDKNILHLVFEQISAFATVGVSMGITSDLSTLGKLIIIISMFIGRVGTVTLALALSKEAVSNAYQYPKTHLLIG